MTFFPVFCDELIATAVVQYFKKKKKKVALTTAVALVVVTTASRSIYLKHVYKANVTNFQL